MHDPTVPERGGAVDDIQVLRSLSSHSGRRGALHRQVVYEPNVQEETLTAVAADSPDLHCTAKAVQPRTTTNTVFP